MNPTSLKVAIGWAEGIESVRKLRIGPYNPKPYQKNYPQTQNPTNPKIQSLTCPNRNPNPPNHKSPSGNPGKPLSERALRDRFSKGLCFKCEEKRSLAHVYKNKEMRLILLEDDDETVESALQVV